MKIKSILKYQLRDYRNIVLVMYLCVYVFAIFIAISNITVHSLSIKGSGSREGLGGLELASMVTLFVIGLNSFKPLFKFFTGNGVSRKTLFSGLLLGMGITAAVMALIDTLNALLFSHVMSYHSMFQMLYFDTANKDLPSNLLPMLAQQFLWLLFAYLWVMMVGFFITNLYYRMNKSTKIAVSIGVPVSVFYILPLLDQYFLNGVLSRAVTSFAGFAWGFSNGYNPFIGMASMFVFAVINAAFAWLLVHRANVKE
jgi:hypothetical protein